MKRLCMVLGAWLMVKLVMGQALSPEVISSGGTVFQYASGSLAWTLGEPVTATLGSTNQLTQGFHQPLLKLVSVQEQTPEILVSVFPNPTTDFVTIQVGKSTIEYRFSLYAMDGKLLQNKLVAVSEAALPQQVSLTSYAMGTYLLVLQYGTQTNTYKIIKNL